MTDSTSLMPNSGMSREAAIERGLGRIEGKMDILLTQFANHAVEDRSNFYAIEKRISSIEKKYIWLTGLWAGIAFLTSAVTFIMFKN